MTPASPTQGAPARIPSGQGQPKLRVRYADGALDDIASVMVGAHPRACDYMEQIPALPIMVASKFGGNITYGELDRFGAIVGNGPRLKDVLSTYSIAPQLRKLTPQGLRLKDRRVLELLGRLDPSSLSQSIPEDSQRVWLDGIGDWLRLMPTARREQAKFSVKWVARQLGENLHRYEMLGALIDYLGRGHGALNERWSFERAMREVEAWHARLRDENALRALARAGCDAASFDTVICNAPLPDEATTDGFDFHVLRTIRQLREEGSAMHHCVASYAADVRRGKCAIASVRKDGVNIATLEVSAAGQAVQIKAHCNRAVDARVKAACEIYTLTYWQPAAKAEAA